MKNSVNDRIGLPRKTAEKLLRGDLVSRLKQHQSWHPTSRHIYNALTSWPGLIEETSVKKSLWLALSYAVPKILKESAYKHAREGNATNEDTNKFIYGAWGRILSLAVSGNHVLTSAQVQETERLNYYGLVANISRNTKQCSGCTSGRVTACHVFCLDLNGRSGRVTSARQPRRRRAEATVTRATDAPCGV